MRLDSSAQVEARLAFVLLTDENGAGSMSREEAL